MGFDRQQQEKRIEDFSAIRWLTGSGSIYRFFYLGKQAKRRENRVWKVPEVGTTHLGAPGKPGTPWCLVPTRVRSPGFSYFPNFLNIPKLTKNIFADFSESVYLPYHVPPLFFTILECSGRFLLCVLPVSKFG